MKSLLLVMMLVMASCKCQKAAESASTGNSATGLTRILYDAYGGREEEGLEIIRSSKELQAFFSRINMTRKPGLPLPEMDFGKEQAVVYFPGKGRHGSDIDLVGSNTSQGVILRARQRKAADAEGSTAVTVPFLLYTMPRTEGPVRLEN